MEASNETWREEVQKLREALADKEEQLSRAVKRRQMRTVAHVEALTLLNRTQAELDESKLKCSSLEETLQSQQLELEERCSRERQEQEKCLKHKLLVMEKEFEEKLQEETQKFTKEREALRKQLLHKQETFEKRLVEEQEKYNEKLKEKERSMEHELLAKQQDFNKMMADVSERWERTGQEWVQLREGMEQKLKESNRLRQEEEDKTKEELKKLSEAVLQLELQVSKKQKKKRFCGCFWKFWKKN